MQLCLQAYAQSWVYQKWTWAGWLVSFEEIRSHFIQIEIMFFIGLSNQKIKWDPKSGSHYDSRTQPNRDPIFYKIRFQFV